jgi:hypothetical protein
VSSDALPTRSPVRYAAALAVVFLALHLPFLPASLEDLDSINFALGLHRFDVAQHQPHPPGYPVFIAAGKIARVFAASDARALALVSLLAAALGVLAMAALFRELDRERRDRWTVSALLAAASAPLYWFTAVRPLSDAFGLAAAVGVQALAIRASTSAGLGCAGFFAGVATGIRSQAAWLTVPIVVLAIVRRAREVRLRLAAAAAIGFFSGVIVWAVPLVWLSGGPAAYSRALFSQGAEDFTGIQMLWTTPTPRVLASALYYAFVAPWAVWQMALVVLTAAAFGAIAMFRMDRGPLVTLAAAFGPYLVFDLLFQETFTTRYALPLVVPVAYLAARGLGTIRAESALKLAVVFAIANVAIATGALAGYSSQKAPAFAMLDDMHRTRNRESVLPVLAEHRREALDLRRPFSWLGDAAPSFSARLPAPPKHEWLEAVKYWNGGGRAPLWFVADPLRSDLALIDHRAPRPYQWPSSTAELLGGTRPNTMAWYTIDHPSWYLGEGWALTPETAGVAQEDHRGPAIAPIDGWIRRRPEASIVMIGGRNMSSAPASIHVVLDGRTIDEPSIPPGFFLSTTRVAAGQLAGAGDYAPLTVSATSDRVAIEQFDAQSAGVIVVGFGEGWYEHEYEPSTGRLWRWTSERATMRVQSAKQPLRLTIAGDTGHVLLASHVTMHIGDRVIAEDDVRSSFSLSVVIPSALVGSSETVIVIETDRTYVPADRSFRSRDRRRLGLRVYRCDVTPVS